jgi:hypothetical protein
VIGVWSSLVPREDRAYDQAITAKNLNARTQKEMKERPDCRAACFAARVAMLTARQLATICPSVIASLASASLALRGAAHEIMLQPGHCRSGGEGNTSNISVIRAGAVPF